MEEFLYLLANLMMLGFLFLMIIIIFLTAKALIIHERLKRGPKPRDFLEEFYEDESK